MRRIYILKDLDIKKNLLQEGFSEKFIEKHHLKFHYYTTRIIYRYMRRCKSSNGFVNLHIDTISKVIKKIKSSTLPKQYQSNSEYTYLHLLIRDLLEKWGVIITHTEQLADRRICRAKIKDEWYDNGYTLYRGEIPKKLKDNIDKVHSAQVNEYKGVYKTLFESMNKINIDEDRALEWLENAYLEGVKLKDKQDKWGNWHSRTMDDVTYSYYRMYIENFNDSKYFYVADSGRVYSSISNIPSLLRQFLNINGEKLVEFDISNAQPLLLNYVLDTDDKYRELTEQGKFYDYLKQELENRGIAVSSNFKVDFFSKILFGKHKIKSQEEYIFEELFPTEWYFLRFYKHSNGYKSLSKLLQSEEANRMYNGVCKNLIDNYNITDIATIHDAILCKESDLEIVKEVMRDCFYDN